MSISDEKIGFLAQLAQRMRIQRVQPKYEEAFAEFSQHAQSLGLDELNALKAALSPVNQGQVVVREV